MQTVKQLLQAKGSQVWTVVPETSMFEALQLMAEKDIGALVVVEDGAVVGIVSERDYARKVTLHGKTSRDTPVSEIMTSTVFFVRPSQSIDECMAQMTERRIRHLPVLDDGRLVGLISIGDVVKAVISQQEFMINQLEQYITSG
jgi:CBS domain-containing protein